MDRKGGSQQPTETGKSAMLESARKPWDGTLDAASKKLPNAETDTTKLFISAKPLSKQRESPWVSRDWKTQRANLNERPIKLRNRLLIIRCRRSINN
jgi:hypothetical protein